MDFLNEAFKSLKRLNEETFDLSAADGQDELKNFIDDDEEIDTITIIDDEAEDAEEIKDSYIGKVILDCNICHSLIYKDKEEVFLDEDGENANVDDECPYCYSTGDGFKIIGQVKPFTKDDEEDEEEDSEEETKEETSDDEETEVEVKEDETEVKEESLIVKRIKNRLQEALKKSNRRTLKESLWSDGEDAYYDIVDRAKSWIDDADEDEELEDCINRAIDDGLIYTQDIVGLAAKYGVINDSDLINEFYEDLFNDIYSAVSDYYEEHMEELKGESDEDDEDDEVDESLKESCKKEGCDSDKEEKLDELFDLNAQGQTIGVGVGGGTGITATPGGLKVPGISEDCKESVGSDLSEYQKWVDYDMKKYGQISHLTKRKIKKAGLEVVKDDHGDYEVIANRPADESLTEAPNYELHPQYDARQSFYGKARVDTGDNNDRNRLYSYDTLVAEIKDGKPVIYRGSKNGFGDDSYSPTTLRHIKDWLKQNGFKAETKQQMLKDYGESLNESIQDMSLTTDDGTEVTMSSGEGGEVTITTKPGCEECVDKQSDETIGEVDLGTELDIENNSQEDPSVDDIEPESEEDEIEIDDFDEESFDELGESYLKKVYENVDSFKVSKVHESNSNRLFIEGLITFNSGNTKKTNFVFKNKGVSKSGKTVFEGYNKEITRSNKSFRLNGRVDGKKLISESLSYRYTQNKQSVNGTVKRG